MFDDIIKKEFKKPKVVLSTDNIICCATCKHGYADECMINATAECWYTGEPMTYKDFFRYDVYINYSLWEHNKSSKV